MKRERNSQKNTTDGPSAEIVLLSCGLVAVLAVLIVGIAMLASTGIFHGNIEITRQVATGFGIVIVSSLALKPLSHKTRQTVQNNAENTEEKQ